MYRDAIESFEKSRDIGGTPSEWDLSAVGQAYARLGNKEKALEILEQIKTSPTLKRMRPTRVAGMYIALGDNDQALEWLEKAYEQHDPRLFRIKTTLMYDPLRSEPRFQALLQKMGLND